MPDQADLNEMYALGLLENGLEHAREQLRRKVGTHELATLLGVTAETVRRQIKAGLITPDTVTPGGHARFSRLTALHLYRSASPACHPQASPPPPQDMP